METDGNQKEKSPVGFLLSTLILVVFLMLLNIFLPPYLKKERAETHKEIDSFGVATFAKFSSWDKKDGTTLIYRVDGKEMRGKPINFKPSEYQLNCQRSGLLCAEDLYFPIEYSKKRIKTCRVLSSDVCYETSATIVNVKRHYNDYYKVAYYYEVDGKEYNSVMTVPFLTLSDSLYHYSTPEKFIGSECRVSYFKKQPSKSIIFFWQQVAKFDNSKYILREGKDIIKID